MSNQDAIRRALDLVMEAREIIIEYLNADDPEPSAVGPGDPNILGQYLEWGQRSWSFFFFLRREFGADLAAFEEHRLATDPTAHPMTVPAYLICADGIPPADSVAAISRSINVDLSIPMPYGFGGRAKTVVFDASMQRWVPGEDLPGVIATKLPLESLKKRLRGRVIRARDSINLRHWFNLNADDEAAGS